MDFATVLSKEFGIRADYSTNIINLIAEGNTIPFIARYRKEATGSCDDQVLREFSERLTYLTNLAKRKEEVRDTITEQGKWTDELAKALDSALKLTEVEDIYRPYKQKRKTRASVAIAQGLQPFADIILAQEASADIEKLAAGYINSEKSISTAAEAINGAKDIIAEHISDDAALRKILREFFLEEGILTVKLLDNEKAKTYEMYKDYSEKISTMPSHRILAVNRGEKEECLKVTLNVPSDTLCKITSKYVKSAGVLSGRLVNEAAEDSYKRLIFPSLERETRSELTDRAFEQAIKMFELNLRPLLLQPPLKGKTVLALDPAYRTGCKVAVVDGNSNVLATDVVYPTPPQSRTEEAEAKLMNLIAKHKVDVISIGNGTASKETEIFAADMIKKCTRPLSYMVVNEAGASVYSASKLGAEEFPQLDVSLRSAVSIARRLQDPLPELIKIDVKSIGVGQYQHDMPEKRLTEVLGGVVESCVNSVGVDLNTASVSLLTYVAGLNGSIAKNILEYRKSKKFDTRKDLLQVPKLGAKTFEQCAGFLRIHNGKNVLDNTAVHPEAYPAVIKLLQHYGLSEEAVSNNKLQELECKIKAEGYDNVANMCGIGVPTLKDIIAELLKPGRDIRDSLPPPMLRTDLMDLKDITPGMEIEGTVRNVIDFGAFIDIGVHQDGLVHISEISDNYIKHPSEVLTVGDRVKVRVISVDVDKKRIALSMKSNAAGSTQLRQKNDTAAQTRPLEPRAHQQPKSSKPQQKSNQPQGAAGQPSAAPLDLDSMLTMLKNKYSKK